MEKDELVVSVFFTGLLFALGFGLTCAGFINNFYWFPQMSERVNRLVDMVGVLNLQVVTDIIGDYWELSIIVMILGFIMLFIGLVLFLYTLNKVHKALTTQ